METEITEHAPPPSITRLRSDYRAARASSGLTGPAFRARCCAHLEERKLAITPENWAEVAGWVAEDAYNDRLDAEAERLGMGPVEYRVIQADVRYNQDYGPQGVLRT